MKKSLDIVDQYWSKHLEYDIRRIKPGQTFIVGREIPYKRGEAGDRVSLIYVAASLNRYLVSAQCELVDKLQEIIDNLPQPEALLQEETESHLRRVCQETLNIRRPLKMYSGPKFYCDEESLVLCESSNVKGVTREMTQEVMRYLSEGGPDLEYAIQEGTAFVWYEGGIPVSYCGTVRPVTYMLDQVARVGGIFTLEEHRRRGFAKAVLSATTRAILDSGRIALYGTFQSNIASINTALSAGYKKYADTFRVDL